MKNLSYVKYTDGYAIGELNKDSYLTGLGYSYFLETNKYVIGTFNHGLRNGWTASNLDNEDDVDTITFRKWKDGRPVQGVVMISNKDVLSIAETDVDGVSYGYDFLIWDDNTWRYQYDDQDASETKAIQFFADSDDLIMTYIVDDKKVWVKEIGKGKISNFGVPFHHFKNQEFNNVDFEQKTNLVTPVGDGPEIRYYERFKQTSIYNIVKGKRNGLLYADLPGYAGISQQKNNEYDGAYFLAMKKNADWKYLYYDKGELHDIAVFWDRRTCNLQVRKYCYDDEDAYDVIDIDKDFNVKYYTNFRRKTKEYDSVVEYDYNKIYLKDNK